jgi:hypothetical protein
VCHASVAHFTRIGNSRTPPNAASFPSPVAGALPVGSDVRSVWNFLKSDSTSSSVRPFNVSVIIDAEAVEMAQPAPSKPASWMRPSRTFR